MTDDDRRIEAWLRQFQPRQPAPLPLVPARRRARRWMALAAALVLVAWLAPLVWRAAGPRSLEPAAGAEAPALREVVAWDTDALDAVLLDTSRVVLPEVDTPDGALRLLARP